MNNHDLYKIKGKGNYIALTPAELALVKPVELLDVTKKQGFLFIHGFTSTPAVFRDLITKFSSDYNIICPCLAGHASTLQAFAASNGKDWFESVLQAYRKLAEYCDTIYVVGLSLGGLLALNLTHQYKVDKLFLLAPALELPYPMWLLKLLTKLASLVMCTVPVTGGNIKKVTSYEIVYSKVPLVVIYNFLNYAQQIRRMGIPTSLPIKIFLGRFDQVVQVKKVEKIFAGKPNCKVVWLEQSAHVLALDNDLDKIVQGILDEI